MNISDDTIPARSWVCVEVTTASVDYQGLEKEILRSPYRQIDPYNLTGLNLNYLIWANVPEEGPEYTSTYSGCHIIYEGKNQHYDVHLRPWQCPEDYEKLEDSIMGPPPESKFKRGYQTFSGIDIKANMKHSSPLPLEDLKYKIHRDEPPKEEPNEHEGMIYNKYTDTWTWF